MACHLPNVRQVFDNDHDETEDCVVQEKGCHEGHRYAAEEDDGSDHSDRFEHLFGGEMEQDGEEMIRLRSLPEASKRTQGGFAGTYRRHLLLETTMYRRKEMLCHLLQDQRRFPQAVTHTKNPVPIMLTTIPTLKRTAMGSSPNFVTRVHQDGRLLAISLRLLTDKGNQSSDEEYNSPK
jgi:hypothetical protein